MAVRKVFLGENGAILESFIYQESEDKAVYLTIDPGNGQVEYFGFENESEIDEFIEELNKLKLKVYGNPI